MTDRFTWVRWSATESKEFPEEAVHLGVINGNTSYVGRTVLQSGERDSTAPAKVLYGKIFLRGGDWAFACYGREHSSDFELLIAPNEGYYWVPTTADYPPSGAFRIAHPNSPDEEGEWYLARAYKTAIVLKDEDKYFYCGFANLDKCYYQDHVLGLQETGTFEILVELPSFIMKSVGGGSTDRSNAIESTVPVGETVNLPNCGWMRCTHKTILTVNQDFLACAGAILSGKSYVVRSFCHNGYISGKFSALHETLPRETLGDRMSEVLIASPGSYMWVQDDVACHMYEKITGNEIMTWSRMFRKSKGGKSQEWDLGIGRRFTNWLGYDYVDCFQHLCKYKSWSDNEPGFECLVFACRQDKYVGGSDELHDQQLLTGVVGWFPLPSTSKLSWPHKWSCISAMELAINSDGLPLENNIIVRTPGDRGHQIEVVDSLEEAILPRHLERIEVLGGSPASCVWVADRDGFVPRGAIIGGETTDNELLYIGRANLNGLPGAIGDGRIGGIRPFSRPLLHTPETSQNVSTQSANEYQVLCAGVSIQKARKNLGPRESATLEISSKAGHPTESFPLNELRKIQQTEIHARGTTGESYDERMGNLFLSLDVDILRQTSSWIPYVSRLARINSLPSSIWPLFFRYIATPSEGAKESSMKSRVASIMKLAVKHVKMKGIYGISQPFVRRRKLVFPFIPYLQYIASDSNQSESTTEDALEAFIAIYKEEDHIGGSWKLPSKWEEVVQRCFEKLGAKQRAEFATRFDFMEVIKLKFLEARSSKQLTMLDEKLEKFKRKSLAPFAIPVSNTVVTEQLQTYYVSSSTVMSDMEKIDVKPILQLYQEYHATIHVVGREDVQENRVAVTESRNALDDFLKSPSQESASILCESLSKPLSLPLTPAGLFKLLSCMTDGLDKDIRTRLCWAMLLSLTKQSKQLSVAEMKANRFTSVPFLLANAAVDGNSSLAEATLSFLFALAEADELKLSESDHAKMTSILETAIGHDITGQLALSILCKHPDLTNKTPLTNAAVFGLLQNSREKITRTLAAKYLSLMSSKHGNHFEANKLKFLATLGDDQVRDVRIYCRVAFANGLLNNKDGAQLRDSMIAEYFPHMFATQPVLLSTPGGPVAAEEFTRDINGPLLKLLSSAEIIPKSTKRAVLKFVENCAQATRKDSVETCSIVREALELLKKSGCKLKGTVTGPEKLFLKAANEYDDENLAVASLDWLITSVENGSHKEYLASGRLLSTISNRMIRASSSIYSQCLHVLSSIQELPQDVFDFYLLELASLRISPKLLCEEITFLDSQDLAVPRSAVELSALARCINEYYKGGVPVSNRTARVLLDSLSEKWAEEQGVLWNCVESMASAGYFFTEEQLELLFKVSPSEQASTAWIKVIENQGLPSTGLTRVLKALKYIPLLNEHYLALAHSIFVASQNQSSNMIITDLISIGMSAIQAASYDEDSSRKGRLLLMRVLETCEIGDRKVEDLKRCLVKVSRSLKEQASLRERDGEKEEHISYIELLLLLNRSHRQRVTWADVSHMATMEGTLLLESKNDDHLRKIFKLWYETAKSQNIGFENFHPFLLLLLLQFEEEPQVLIQSLCHYLHGEASDENAQNWLAKITRKSVREDTFYLQIHHTHRFRVVLQQDDQACQRVLKALKGTRKTGRHLEILGDTIFMAWSRAQNIQIEHACEEMLHVLVKKGWRLKSAELVDDAKLLARIEGNAGLRLLVEHILVDGSAIPHSQCSAGGKKQEMTRQKFVYEILRPALAYFKVQDMTTKVLLHLLIGDIYDSLEKAGHVELTGPLLNSILSSYRKKMFPFDQSPMAVSRLIEGATEGTGYLFFQDIRLYVKSSTFSQATLLATDNIAMDAQIFSLGLRFHRKLQLGKTERISKHGSLILASRIVSAYNDDGRGHAAELGLGHIQSFQNYEEIFLHAEMIFRFGTLRAHKSLEFSADNVINMMEGSPGCHFTWNSGRDLYDTCRWMVREENLRSMVWQGSGSVSPQFPPRPTDWKYLPTINLSSIYDVESSVPEEFDFRSSEVEYLSKMNIRLKEIPDQFLLRRSAEGWWLKDISIQKTYRKGIKSVEEIVEEFLELNKDAKLARDVGGNLVDTLKDILRNGCKDASQVFANRITEWSKNQVQKWAESTKDRFYSAKELPSIPFYLSVARRAVQLVKGWTLTPTQILTAYLALHNVTGGGNKGQFFQVSTGSGKSAIIAVLAAAKALLYNLRVDIHNHNPLLAQRDAQDWSEFYDLFNIKCFHNVEENICNNAGDYIQGRKGCYAKEFKIVYGYTRQFQFDSLRSEYLALNTRAGRLYQCAIFDEVDSMCIDDAEKLTILSSPIAGMELLQPLYHRIWDELCALNESTNLVQIHQSHFTYAGAFQSDKTNNNNELIYIRDNSRVTEKELLQLIQQPPLMEETEKEERLESLGIHDRRSFLKDKLIGIIQKLTGQAEHSGTNDESQTPDSNEYSNFTRSVSIPNNLRSFVVSQIGMWAESALKALVLQENKDYVIIEGKTVVPLDPNNGTTMEVSSWSNGLHQFLQIKHSLEFLPESLPVAYLSNKAMMGKYIDGELIGFSGTLKGTEKFFIRSYNTQIVHIPDLHYSCFCQFPPRIRKTTKDWIDTISKAASRQMKVERAVLIICKSINVAARLKAAIEQLPDSQISAQKQSTPRVLLHVRSDRDEGKVGRAEEWRAQPADVIITTLLGARGMDVKTGDIERHGGLHVILTFLLPNTRLEAQAFGRTARQGNHGSVQYIIKVPKEFEQQDLVQMMAQRDTLDRRYLESLEKDIFPVISSKDEAFKVYAEAFRSLYAKLPQSDVKRQVKLKSYGHKFSESDWTLLDAYQEYWATHSATTTNNFSGVSPHQPSNNERNTAHPQLLNALKQFYKPVELEGRNEKSVDVIEPADIFRLTKSCFLPSRYAFHYYSENTFFPLMKTTDEAQNFFTLAIELDKKHAAGAYVGLAYLELLGDKFFYLVQTQTKGYKSRAVDYLKEAQDILTSELRAFQFTSESSSLKQKNSQQPCRSPYEVQLYERMEVLKRYAGVINATLDFVSDSQRPVCVTSSLNRDLVSWTNAHEKVLPISHFDSSSETLFNLRCHGLRWEKDVGTGHEVKDAVSVISGTGLGVRRLPSVGKKEGRGDHTGALITLSFADQNAQKLKSLLMLMPGVFLGEESRGGINVGGDPDSLQHVKTVEELRCIAANLRGGREIFLQLEATGVMKVLDVLRKNDPHGAGHHINADTITFHDLSKAEAVSVFEALQKNKNPITQRSLKRLSEFYATEFQPLQILNQLKQRGLSWTAEFDELGKIRRKSMWILGATFIAEVTMVSALSLTGAGALVVPLIVAGAVRDAFAVISSLLFRDFSWKSYGIAKILGFCIGLGVGGLESLTSSVVNAGGEVEAAKLLADINISTVLTKVGLSGLKLLLTKAGGYLFRHLCKKERKTLVKKVTETVEKYLEKEQSRMKELLTSFRAIKGLELDDHDFVSDNFTHFFQIWAESVGNQVNWKLHKLKESAYSSVLKETTGLALQGKLISLLSLSVLPYEAYKLIMRHLNVSEATLKACEALQEELEKYVRRFDLHYILTTFCGLTMEQVVEELSIPADVYPPFAQGILPETVGAFGSVTKEQLSDAKVIVNRFQNGPRESNIVLSEFASCLSDFVTDHLIGFLSNVISEAINSKSLKPAADPGLAGDTSDSKLNNSNCNEQQIVKIPSLGQPENPKMAPSSIDHAEMQNHNSETPTTLLSAWIKDTKTNTEDPNDIEDCSTSTTAKFLSQVLLFCCLNGKSVRLFEEGYKVEQVRDNRKPWDEGLDKIEYKLDDTRSKIVMFKVKNEEREEEWQLTDDDSCNISACDFLSKLFDPQDVASVKESMEQDYSNYSVALHRMENIAEELIADKLA